MNDAPSWLPMVFSALGGAVGSYLAIKVDLAVMKARLDGHDSRFELQDRELVRVRDDLHSVRGHL